MILQIFADARPVGQHVDAECGQPGAVADARSLEDGGAADRPGRQDDFAIGLGGAGVAVQQEAHAGGAALRDRHPVDRGAGDDAQIGAVHRRAQEGVGRAPAPAAPLRHLKIARPQIVAAVEVGGFGHAILAGGQAETVEQIPAQPLPLDPYLAACAMGGARPILMILRPHEIGQDIVPAPADIAGLPPAIIIGGLAAHVDHAVDRAAAADHPAARIGDGAGAKAGRRLGLQAPVGARIAHAIKIADRDLYPQPVILAARLQQQHAVARIGTQPVGQHASRAARAQDDIIPAAKIPVHRLSSCARSMARRGRRRKGAGRARWRYLAGPWPANWPWARAGKGLWQASDGAGGWPCRLRY